MNPPSNFARRASSLSLGVCFTYDSIASITGLKRIRSEPITRITVVIQPYLPARPSRNGCNGLSGGDSAAEAEARLSRSMAAAHALTLASEQPSRRRGWLRRRSRRAVSKSLERCFRRVSGAPIFEDLNFFMRTIFAILARNSNPPAPVAPNELVAPFATSELNEPNEPIAPRTILLLRPAPLCYSNE